MDQCQFHLSIPAADLQATRCWYERVLGCVAGRSSGAAVILDLAGHQLVAQHHPAGHEPCQSGIYPRHFGLVFNRRADWQALQRRVEASGEPFAVAPKCRYAGSVLEHHTFFLQDPSGNWLEFKHYSQPEAVLGCTDHASVGDPELRAAGSSASP
jgi:extradiol dioxygenase family protein